MHAVAPTQPDFLPPLLRRMIPYFLLVLAVAVFYSNVYDNQFLFDDDLLIVQNQLLRYWSNIGHLLTASTTDGAHIAGGFYRPVQLFLYLLVYQLGDNSLFNYHLLNVALHAGNACLVYLLGKKLAFDPRPCLFAALIWALHPLHTEAITYISATADPLHVFFCLLGLIILLPDFSTRRILCALPVFMLALLSKETAVIFPLLAMLSLYLTSDQRLSPKTYLKTWPLWLVAATFTAWRITAPGFDGPETYQHMFARPEYLSLRLHAEHFEIRTYTFLATLPNYLKLLIWPEGLHMERTFPVIMQFWLPSVLIGTVLFMLAIVQIICARTQRSLPMSWGLLWFGAAYFPNSGLLLSINALFLEHWMYLPSIGLLLGIAQTLSIHLTNRRAKYAAAGLALIAAAALGTATYLQNRTWHDPITFYKHLFTYGVTSARAHNNLALAYINNQQIPEAIDEFHKAIAVSDSYAETHHNLAAALLNLPDRSQHFDEAIEELNRALQIDPNFFRSYILLSQIYAFQKDPDKAAFYREKAEAILNREP